MQHRRKGRVLKREKAQREALLRSLSRAIIVERSIVTTEAKAKAVRPYLERLVTKAKSGRLSLERRVAAEVGKDAARELKKEIVPALGDRKGGYLRITKYGVRKSDASRMAHISFVT